MKTIKKLGFSVNAVWDGREALDYLLEKPSADHPRPHVILMDVQMPILDGYRATHTIRTQEPYKSSRDIRRIPIVAMTASAIQGDREKCQRAGMDDYLAKPVKPLALEKMLVKWAGQAKRDQEIAERQDSQVSSEWSRERQLSTPTDGSEGLPARDDQHPRRNAESLTRHLSDKLSSIDHSNRSIMHQSGETENDREHRRAEAEEKALSLRDDKLLAATDDPRLHQHLFSEEEKAAYRGGRRSDALTKENMEKFELQQGDGRAARPDGTGDIDSSMTGGTPNGRFIRSRSSEAAGSPSADSQGRRPRLANTRQYESERTVTGRPRRRGG